MDLPNFSGLLQNRRVVLGICASVAIYKSFELLRLLQKSGAQVRVVMSEKAAIWVNPLLFESLGASVFCGDESSLSSGKIGHIELANFAELFVVAPASANSIAAFANGLANNALCASFLAFNGAKIIAPAMNTKMLENPATQDNLELLQKRGIKIIAPQEKLLACKEQGNGALAEPYEIFCACVRELFCASLIESKNADSIESKSKTCFFSEFQNAENLVKLRKFWQDRRVCISGGGSLEKIDNVRYLGNFSSGKTSAFLALCAYFLGARVSLVASSFAFLLPKEIKQIKVQSGAEFLSAIRSECTEFCELDSMNLIESENAKSAKKAVFFSAAAIADFLPKNVKFGKIKKEQIGAEWALELVQSKDILSEISKEFGEKIIKIGFKLESAIESENESISGDSSLRATRYAQNDKNVATRYAKNEEVPQNALNAALDSIKKKNLDGVCLNWINKDQNPLGADFSRIIFIGKNKKDLIQKDSIKKTAKTSQNEPFVRDLGFISKLNLAFGILLNVAENESKTTQNSDKKSADSIESSAANKKQKSAKNLISTKGKRGGNVRK